MYKIKNNNKQNKKKTKELKQIEINKRNMIKINDLRKMSLNLILDLVKGE